MHREFNFFSNFFAFSFDSTTTEKSRRYITEETISTLNGATVIRAVQKENTLTESMKVFDPLENSSQGSDTIHEQVK